MPVGISVIVPVLNEEQNIHELYTRLTNILTNIGSSYEIILVNDGSRDRTLYAIENIAGKDPQLKYISFTRNFGHQVALFAGLEKCKGQFIVLMDGDLQDPPEIIGELMNTLNKGFDIVYAKRNNRSGETFFEKGHCQFLFSLHPIIIKEIYRVLKPGGRLYLFEHNPLNPVTKHLVKTCVFDKNARLLSYAYAKKILREQAFTSITKKFILFFPRKGILSKLVWLETYLWWLPLGGQYYFRAVK